jgi:hypothetical protein
MKDTDKRVRANVERDILVYLTIALLTLMVWKTVIKFDHNKTEFPLLLKHVKVECAACHKTLLFKEAAKDCYSCHKVDDKHMGHLELTVRVAIAKLVGS